MKWISSFIKNFRPIFYLLLLLLGFHTLLRLIFILYNRNILDVSTALDVVKIIYSGLQQDLTSILLLNLPFIF